MIVSRDRLLRHSRLTCNEIVIRRTDIDDLRSRGLPKVARVDAFVADNGGATGQIRLEALTRCQRYKPGEAVYVPSSQVRNFYNPFNHG